MAERNKLVSWIVNMPSSHLATILTVTALIFVLFPQAFPLRVNENVQAYYDFIEAMQPGDVFVYDVSQNIQAREVVRSSDLYVMAHLWEKPGIKIIAISFSAPGPVNWETMQDVLAPSTLKKKTYGVDVVYLGYIPGDQSGIAAFCSNIRSVKTEDYYGTPIDDIPMMTTGNPKTGGPINDASAFYGCLYTYWNAAMIQAYAQVLGDTWGVPIVRTSSSWVTDAPYYPRYLRHYIFSAQFVEYESLLLKQYGYIGINQVYYTIQAIGCGLFVGLLIIANIVYWADRISTSRRKEAVIR